MAELNIPDDVLQAAAERANQEQRSLPAVITALLRDYAAGRTRVRLSQEEPPLRGIQIGDGNVQSNSWRS